MRDTDFEKTLYKFSLAVKKSDLSKADKCFGKISNKISKGKPVSAKILNEFFGYLVDYGGTTKLKQIERLTKSEQIIEHTFDRFSKVKDYNFSNKEHDFKKMIQQCVLLYFSYKEHETNLQKDDIIRFVYRNLTNYTKKLSKVKQKNYTHYKIATLSGYLTHLLEYKLTEKKSPTNSDFFTATRNALNSPNKKA